MAFFDGEVGISELCRLVIHGRATSSRAMKCWLAASLSSTSCVNWLLSKTVSKKKHCFPFRPVQFNSISEMASLPWAHCTTSRKEISQKKCHCTTERQILVDVWNIPAGWSNFTHKQYHLLGRLVWNCVGWSQIIIPFSRKSQDSKPPNYTTNDCWNLSTCPFEVYPFHAKLT